jgi:hypothetical protein
MGGMDEHEDDLASEVIEGEEIETDSFDADFDDERAEDDEGAEEDDDSTEDDSEI